MDLNKIKNITIRQFRIILFLGALFISRSCSPDPSLEILENFSIDFEGGTGKRVLPGEKIDVLLKVHNNLTSVNDSVKVEFEIISGGGSLSVNSAYTGDDGTAFTEWTPGNESYNSKLRASVYKLTGEYLTDKYLTASCFVSDAWNEVTDDPDGSITDMVADTVNHLTFMVAKGALYKQGERYFIWEKITEPLVESPRTIELGAERVV